MQSSESKRGGVCFCIGNIGAVFVSSPHSTTPPFLQHLPHPLRISDTKGSIFTMILLMFTSVVLLILLSYPHHSVTSFSPSSSFLILLQPKGFQCQIQKANLPVCLLAIGTKVLVALVEHVSVSVLEIHNLRYGNCQAGNSSAC